MTLNPAAQWAVAIGAPILLFVLGTLAALQAAEAYVSAIPL